MPTLPLLAAGNAAPPTPPLMLAPSVRPVVGASLDPVAGASLRPVSGPPWPEVRG